LIIGVLLGWGIGAAGMKAATAARDKVFLKSSLQQAQETYVYCHYAARTSLSCHMQCCKFCKPGTSV
jgi:hypothetical protein